MHNPLERLDDLLIDGIKLWQRKDEFCFSIDAIILANFANCKPWHRYVDLGTGTGVIPLLLTTKGCQNIVGFELNPVTADLAKRNVIFNHCDDKITIVEGDYRHIEDKNFRGSFDGVLVNPPYQAAGSGIPSERSGRSLALHEVETTLEEVIVSAKQLLRYGGKLWMVHAAHRLTDIIAFLRKHNMEPKRLRMVHSASHKEARLVLVEAMYGGKASLRIEKPLVIYEDAKEGRYSEEVLKWYGR